MESETREYGGLTWPLIKKPQGWYWSAELGNGWWARVTTDGFGCEPDTWGWIVWRLGLGDDLLTALRPVSFLTEDIDLRNHETRPTFEEAAAEAIRAPQQFVWSIQALAAQASKLLQVPSVSAVPSEAVEIDPNAAVAALQTRAAQIAALAPMLTVNIEVNAGHLNAGHIHVHDHGENGKIVASAYGTDITTGLDKVDGEVRKLASARADKVTRRLALAIVEATSDHGTCSLAHLKAAGFGADDIALYGPAACERAALMAGGQTFSIAEA